VSHSRNEADSDLGGKNSKETRGRTVMVESILDKVSTVVAGMRL
jgi:hypothetical protein